MLESSLWSLLSLATTSSPSGNPVGSIFLTLFLQNPSPVLASALPPAWARPLWHAPEFLQHPHPRGLSASLLVPLRLVWTSSRVKFQASVKGIKTGSCHSAFTFCIHFPFYLLKKPKTWQQPQALGDLAFCALGLLLLVHSQWPPRSGSLPWGPCREYSCPFSVTCVTIWLELQSLLSEALSTHFTWLNFFP